MREQHSAATCRLIEERVRLLDHECEDGLSNALAPRERLDPKTGLRRLENPDDFVRIEIGTALSRGIPVVPVILDDAPMPGTHQLPNELSNLFDMQAEFISFRTFYDDVKRLITKLKIKSTQKLEPSARFCTLFATTPLLSLPILFPWNYTTRTARALKHGALRLPTL